MSQATAAPPEIYYLEGQSRFFLGPRDAVCPLSNKPPARVQSCMHFYTDFQVGCVLSQVTSIFKFGSGPSQTLRDLEP